MYALMNVLDVAVTSDNSVAAWTFATELKGFVLVTEDGYLICYPLE